MCPYDLPDPKFRRHGLSINGSENIPPYSCSSQLSARRRLRGQGGGDRGN